MKCKIASPLQSAQTERQKNTSSGAKADQNSSTGISMPAVSVQMQSIQPPVIHQKERDNKDTSQFKPFQFAAKRTGTPNNTGMPDDLKAGVESLSGFSMDDVKVHYNSPKPSQLRAFAYAKGTDIHIGPGQEKHLPHEAWHVVQQKQGRVQPTRQMKGDVAINDDKGLEKEADLMGMAASDLKTPIQAKHFPMSHGSSDSIIQRKLRFNGDDNDLTLQQVKDWLLRSGHTFEMLKKYTPKIIEEINDASVIILHQDGQKDYLDGLVRRANIKGEWIFPNEGPLSTTNTGVREEFDRRFNTGTMPKQDLGQWVGVAKTGSEDSKFGQQELLLYQKIQSYLLDPGLVFKVLNELNNYVKLVGPKTLSGEQWHKEMLGGLLQSGFTQSPPVITELLSADEFMNQTTGSGNLSLDTGADEKYYEKDPEDRKTENTYPIANLPKHGALSHTIQWLIIQEGIKNQPEANSLLQLFSSTSKYKKIDDKTPYLWSSLVDLPPIHGFVVNATMPEGLTTLINACFPFIKTIEDDIEKKFLESLVKPLEQPSESIGESEPNVSKPEVKKPMNKLLLGIKKQEKKMQTEKK